MSTRVSVLTGSTGFVSLPGTLSTSTLGELDSFASLGELVLLASVDELSICESSTGRSGKLSSVEVGLSE